MKVSDKHVAGILFMLLAGFPLGIWAVFLFVGNPPDTSLTGQLLFTFSSENEHSTFFLWLAASAVVSVSVAVMWLSCSMSRLLVTIVVSLSVAQALGYLVWSQWVEMALTLLPLYWVYRAYKSGRDRLLQSTS